KAFRPWNASSAPRTGPGAVRGPRSASDDLFPSPEPMQARPIRDRPTGDPAHVQRREGTMGEAEHTDRETRTGVPATATDNGDAAACTVGGDSADSGPAGLGAEHGDGKPATFGSGTAADSPGS